MEGMKHEVASREQVTVCRLSPERQRTWSFVPFLKRASGSSSSRMSRLSTPVNPQHGIGGQGGLPADPDLAAGGLHPAPAWPESGTATAGAHRDVAIRKLAHSGELVLGEQIVDPHHGVQGDVANPGSH
jgi:hypothetical protein